MVAIAARLEEVVEQVKSWPAEDRITLARRVLETLEAEPAKASTPRGPALDQVLGLWQPTGPIPDDEECRQTVMDHRLQKYGS
jgi:hypothetical protein